MSPYGNFRNWSIFRLPRTSGLIRPAAPQVFVGPSVMDHDVWSHEDGKVAAAFMFLEIPPILNLTATVDYDNVSSTALYYFGDHFGIPLRYTVAIYYYGILLRYTNTVY